jgi:hypothetical protein
MFTKDVHAAIPSAQNFHPEFGYLCPSAQMRRKVRSAAMTVMVGMVIAAGTALALVPELAPQLVAHPSGEGAREELALSVVTAVPPLDKGADSKAADKSADDGISATMARSTPATDRAAVPHAQISCDDLSGSFLAPQCQLGKTGKAGKSHMTRSERAAASQRVVTVSIGRADATVQVDQQNAEPQKAEPQRAEPRRSEPQRSEQQQAAASRPAAAVPAAVATNEAPTVLAPEKPAAPAKKPVQTVHKQPPSSAPGRDNAGADTVAATPLSGFSLFRLFHEPPRTGTGVWAMSW